MRRHHLGKPKTPKSRRTVEYGEVMGDALRRLTDGHANDDFVVVTRARGTSTALRWVGGLPWYESDFYEGRWVPALAAARTAGLLPYIQAQLGHESITTTIDTYGHLDAQLEPERHARLRPRTAWRQDRAVPGLTAAQ
jgi:integrase